MPEIGQSFSHYSIVEKIGKGGMGEVYAANDLNLSRKVALKFLPEAFAGDPERMARFEREAKLLASLNHPNIAAIYGLEQAEGKRFLVLELVEGETLAQRLSKGALPVEEALAVCRQIADGLEAAHEKGVIHRDLKPANVMITEGDRVKILDFGLAKALSDETQSADISQSPTLTEAMTRPGVILGTAAYMSPEQAKGKSADRRADIWALGCILYECLTGKRAFEGETVSETLAAILRGEPDLKALPATTPVSMRTLLLRCLQKDPNRRFHDAADARIELEELLAAPSEFPGATVSAPHPWIRSRAIPWILVVLLAGATVFVSRHAFFNVATTAGKLVRFSVAAPKDFRPSGRIALSPDGSRLAFVAQKGKISRLYIRPLDQSEAFALPGSDGAYSLFWSPDGKWIAFTGEREMKKLSLEGGSPQVLCQAEFPGGAWGADGTIIYTPTYSSGLWRIPSSGGVPQKLTEPNKSEGELGHWYPQLLPDGETVLFTNYATPFERCRIKTFSLKDHRQKVLVEGALYGHYLPSGHLVYVKSETLMAVPFDLRRLQVTGTPVPVLDDLAVEFASGLAAASFSKDGTLAYIRASSISGKYSLVRIDGKGNVRLLTDALRNYFTPKISPDGRRIALGISEGGKAPDIWTFDLERGAFTRVTFGAGWEGDPLWANDSKKLIFASEQPQFDLHQKASDGTGAEESLVTSPFDKIAGTISRDGKILIYSESNPKTAEDLWVLPLEGNRKPRLWLQTSFGEVQPSLSPDGRWLAYVSDESRQNEVYVQSFPDRGERIQISDHGGMAPMWAQNGRELYYFADDRLMAIPVTTGDQFKAGKPAVLFDLETKDIGHSSCTISPDGTWFAGLRRDPKAKPVEVEVVLNWFEELKRLVPSGR